MFRLFSLFMFKVLGWRLDDRRPPGLDRYIVVVAPHTSNWDFFIGLFTRSALRMGDVKYLAKKELFRFPLGWLFKALGGFPVDRSRHTNMVDAVVDLFRTGRISKIAITPEGTRRYQPDWKTGFHRIARQAEVPIVLASFDYPNRLVELTPPFTLTDDAAADIARMKDHFRSRKGFNPEQGVR